MRITLLSLVTLCAAPAIAQAPHEYVQVVTVDSARTADELYRTAKRWFVDTFKDAKEVIQLDDPANHTIVGKGVFDFSTRVFYGSGVRKGLMHFSVEVICKDGRYRIRFYDFTHTGSPTYTQYGMAPAFDMGLIYDGTVCSKVEQFAKQPKYCEHVCTKEVWPQIHTTEATLRESLHTAMMSATPSPSTAPGSSDW